MSIQKKFKTFLFLRPFLCLSLFFSATLLVWGAFYYREHQNQKTIELETELRFVAESFLLQFSEEKLREIADFLKDEVTSFEKLETFKPLYHQLQKIGETRANFHINFFQYIDSQKVRLLDSESKLSKYAIENEMLAKIFERNSAEFLTAFDKNAGKKWTLVKIIQDAKGYPLLGLSIEYLEPWNQHLLENVLSFPSLIAYFFFISISLFLYFYFRWLYFNENRELKQVIRGNSEKKSFDFLRFHFVDSELPQLFNDWMKSLSNQMNEVTEKFNRLAEEKNILLFQDRDAQRIKKIAFESRASYWLVWDENQAERRELSHFRDYEFSRFPSLKAELSPLLAQWAETSFWQKKVIQDYEIKPLRIEGNQKVFLTLLFFAKNKEVELQEVVERKNFESSLLRDVLQFLPFYYLKAKEIEFLLFTLEHLHPFKRNDKKDAKNIFARRLYAMLSESQWELLFPEFEAVAQSLLESSAFASSMKKEILAHPLLKIANQFSFKIHLSEWREKVCAREAICEGIVFKLGKDACVTFENIFYLNNWVKLLASLLGGQTEEVCLEIVFQEEIQGWSLFELKLRGEVDLFGSLRKVLREVGEFKAASLTHTEFWTWLNENPITLEKIGLSEVAYLILLTQRLNSEFQWYVELFFEASVTIQMVHTPSLLATEPAALVRSSPEVSN